MLDTSNNAFENIFKKKIATNTTLKNKKKRRNNQLAGK